MTRRLLPAPLTSLVLALLWPVLNQSWSLGHLMLGLALALLVPWVIAPAHEASPKSAADAPRAPQPLPRRLWIAVRLTFIVLKDIVTSNIDVAQLILGRESSIRPAFVWVPLSITDPHGIVVLAGVITMTPGTLSADLSDDRKHLLVHAFNVDDEAALVATIKARYETPLREIFE
ncbi:MAG: hypothetical protein AD742_02840 [Methylibium sp. NZG]|nr:MAG: hypothetical protein AD742_02840 [Methylibium sp. NZG]